MWKWIRLGLLVIVMTGLLVWPALAAENRILNLNLFTQQDLRALAMGNAFGPIARGETALFYNPAGLAQYDLDLKAEGSIGLTGESGRFAQDTYALTGGSGVSAPDLQKYLETYESTTQRYNAQVLLSGVANLGQFGWGIGGANLDSYRYQLAFTDPMATPGNVLDDRLTATESRVRMQTAAVAFKLAKGKALIGLAAKSFTYSEQSDTIVWDAATVASGEIDFTFAGPTYPAATAYDVGLLYRMEFWPALKPQMSLTAYNVGGVTLKKTGEDTLEVPASYNIGFAFGPDTGFVHWLISAEIEDVSGALKVTDRGSGANATLSCTDLARTETCVNQPRTLLQRSHLGAEIGFWRTPTGNNIISLRAGNNRGYFTYGWEINLWALRLLYARGADNLGWKDSNDKFDFTGYQVGVALAW